MLTPKNKLKFTHLQTQDKDKDSHVNQRHDQIFTVNLHRRTITDDGTSHVKGNYNPRGFIVWPGNIDNIIWVKGIVMC